MRLIKAFLVGFSGLVIIITLFSLLIPSKVMVSRGVLINNTSSAEVYRQVANFENWKQWHPIFAIDSADLYRHPPAIAGNGSSFHIIHHHQDIAIDLVSADTSSVKFLLLAKGENNIENDIVITQLSAQQSVQVEWRAITRLHWYPWEKFYGIFIDKLTGPGYEAALNGLKEYIEKSPLSP
ncbi:MAG: hypothetical protein H7Z13_19405 [Ferruginibacter sp.]|nr:hypothetical protein [Ferruginibacter sp.]